MEKKYENLKDKKNTCFEMIKQNEKILKNIRKECDHPEEYYEKVTYCTRPGQNWENTTICGVCGEVMKWPFEENELDNLTNDQIQDIKKQTWLK